MLAFLNRKKGSPAPLCRAFSPDFHRTGATIPVARVVLRGVRSPTDPGAPALDPSGAPR